MGGTKMKKLILLPYLILFGLPVIAEVKTDIRLLCIRNQRAYDVSFRAARKASNYRRDTWLEAYQTEKKKFEDRGERLSDVSVVDEPYKSIRKEHNRLNFVSKEKRNNYAKTLVPILELAGYERPRFYLWYYTAYNNEIRERHNIIDLNQVEELSIADDYYSHTGQGNDTRDELCKLYGFEFNKRYFDQEFLKKYGL